MTGTQSITILEDSSVPGGGYAVIRVAGVRTEPSDLSFFIRRIGYDQANLGYNGWQGPEERLEPFDSQFQPGTLELMIGPEVVDAVDVGTAIEIEVPGLGLLETLYWPDITPSVMGGAGPQGRRVAFAERPEPAEPRTMTPPTMQAAQATPQPPPPLPGPPSPGPLPIDDDWDADPSPRSGRPPPPPPPEDEPTVVLGEADLSGFRELGEEPRREEPKDSGRDGGKTGRKSGLAPALIAAGVVLVLLGVGAVTYFMFGEDLGLRSPTIAEDTPPSPPSPPDTDQALAPPADPPAANPLAPTEPPAPEPTLLPPPAPAPEPIPQLPDPATAPPPAPRAGDPPTEVALQPRPRQPQTPPHAFVRSIAQADPTPQTLYDLGGYHLGEGDDDVALLLFQQAERQGYGPAITAIGRMYDPVHFAPDVSAFNNANPERAIEYYQEARDAGDAAADTALADLRDWLETEAADGDPTAQGLLREYWQDQ